MGEAALQNLTAWEPSPLQAKVLAAAIESEGKATVTAICDEAGVSRVTFYEWMKTDPGFKQKYNSLWPEAVENALTTVVKSIVAKAHGGDVSAMRLVMELRGVIKPKGDGGNTTNNQTNIYINLDFSKLNEDELRQYRSLCAAVETFRRRIGIGTAGEDRASAGVG